MLGGKVGDQPVQAVQVRKQSFIGGGLRGRGREHRRGRFRAAAERIWRFPRSAFEQLPDDSETERTVELRAAAAKHPDAGVLTKRSGEAKQLRLPDTGPPLDEDHPSARALGRSR